MKNSSEDLKFKESLKNLGIALKFMEKAKTDEFYFSGLSKSFEVCFEYAWKYFKLRAQNEGLEVFSPKEAIKMAGRMKLIDDVEKWLGFLEDRNIAVHDYMGMDNEDYLKTIVEFYEAAQKI